MANMTREKFLQLQQAKQNNANTTKTGFKLVLMPHFEKRNDMTEEELAQVDLDNRPIQFDVVEDKSVSSTSSVTTYPIVNGDTVADHMIREPISVSFSGVFSLYGNKPTDFYGSDDRLTNIEDFFEKLKRTGTFCTIVTMETSNNSTNKQRFKSRDNMVLTSIVWNEGQASLSFSFTFTEVLLVDVNEVEVDTSDENLPAITDAKQLDFTDTLLDWSQVDMIVTQQLRSYGLIEDEFVDDLMYWLNTIGEAGTNYALGGLTVGGIAAIATLTTVFVVVGSIPVAGWIAAGVMASVGFIAGGIWACIQSLKRSSAERDFAVQTFKHYEDDVKAQQECIRFTNYLGSIHQQLEYLENVMQVYGIASNEEQECTLYIDNSYYVFTFKKNNAVTENGVVTWSCNVQEINNTVNKDIPDISSAALSKLDECTTSNMLFRTQTGGGFWVYFINLERFSTENGTYNSESERQDAINAVNSDLTKYAIFVSQTNMDEFNNNLAQIIVDAMKM